MRPNWQLPVDLPVGKLFRQSEDGRYVTTQVTVYSFITGLAYANRSCIITLLILYPRRVMAFIFIHPQKAEFRKDIYHAKISGYAESAPLHS